LHKALKYFDLSLKIEVTMHELSSLLFSMSLFELFMFVVGAIFSLKMGGRTNFWLFLPHLARGICGLVIQKNLPKSHEIVEKLHFEQLDHNVSFEAGHQKLRLDLKTIFFEEAGKLQKFFKVYAALCLVAGFVDTFNLFVVVYFFADKGKEYEEMSMLIVGIAFWCTNLAWVGFVYLLSFKFPDYIQKHLGTVLMSFHSLVEQNLESAANKTQQKATSAAKYAKTKYNERKARQNPEPAAELVSGE
jgi:hypothetical protein